MAHEKVGDADTDAGNADTDESAPPKKSSSGKKSPPAKKSGSGKKSSPAGGSKAAKTAKDSGTAKRAAEARTAMQRQHRRIGFVRGTAVGVEAAGAAGLVAGSLLAWDWSDPLWGRADGPGLTAQVALALAVLGLVGAWAAREDWWRIASRTVAIAAALVVATTSVALVWQAELGGRGPGGVVAAIAAGLVVAGTVGWLLGLWRLRKLFAFGVGYARRRGYGNLPAVRRAQLMGGPVGAVGAAAVVAGALLVVPGMVSTEDSTTAGGLVLDGEPPTGGGEPSWEIELATSLDPPPAVRATPGGLVVDELHGVRVVDPHTGETRWHWRDEAYRRAAVVLIDDGDTIVLALRYDGGQEGRDRVLALDSATGEPRWDRVDDDLVEGLIELGVAAPAGDWIAVPLVIEPPVDPSVDPSNTTAGVRLVGGGDGETLWTNDGAGCQLSSLGAGTAGAVMVVETCPVEGAEPGVQECRVAALGVADGQPLWSWPDGERLDPEQEYATGCRATALGDLVFVNYQVTAREPDPEQPAPEQPVLALDAGTGAEVWAAEPDEESDAPAGVDGLNDPRLVVGDTVVGLEWPSGQSGTGEPALVLRDVSDGTRVGEVVLPEGLPLAFQAVGDGTVMISEYQATGQEQVVLLEVDLATAEVTAESLVKTPPSGLSIGNAGLAVGPETVAVDTLVGTGPEDVQLVVLGFG